MGGLGLRPVLVGLIAQYGPAPRVLLSLWKLSRLRPLRRRLRRCPRHAPLRWQPRRPQIPAEVRGIFATTGLACFLAFAVIGLFLTLIPAYVVSLSYSANLLLAGSAVALVLACSMLAQLAGYRRPTRDLEGHGLPLLATGLLLLAIAGAISSLPSCSSRQPQRESGRAWCSSEGSPAWPVLMRYRRTGATSCSLRQLTWTRERRSRQKPAGHTAETGKLIPGVSQLAAHTLHMLTADTD
jgi:hypothetical protein